MQNDYENIISSLYLKYNKKCKNTIFFKYIRGNNGLTENMVKVKSEQEIRMHV